MYPVRFVNYVTRLYLRGKIGGNPNSLVTEYASSPAQVILRPLPAETLK